MGNPRFHSYITVENMLYRSSCELMKFCIFDVIIDNLLISMYAHG